MEQNNNISHSSTSESWALAYISPRCFYFFMFMLVRLCLLYWDLYGRGFVLRAEPLSYIRQLPSVQRQMELRASAPRRISRSRTHLWRRTVLRRAAFALCAAAIIFWLAWRLCLHSADTHAIPLPTPLPNPPVPHRRSMLGDVPLPPGVVRRASEVRRRVPSKFACWQIVGQATVHKRAIVSVARRPTPKKPR